MHSEDVDSQPPGRRVHVPAAPNFHRMALWIDQKTLDFFFWGGGWIFIRLCCKMQLSRLHIPRASDRENPKRERKGEERIRVINGGKVQRQLHAFRYQNPMDQMCRIAANSLRANNTAFKHDVHEIS